MQGFCKVFGQRPKEETLPSPEEETSPTFSGS